MSEVSSIALTGLNQAAQTVEQSAQEISSGADLGDGEAIVKIKQAEISFKANAKVLEVDKKLGGYILDILA